jgi:hypothetical protein
MNFLPPTPEAQVHFLRNLQRLLAEGLFVASYKFALIHSIADICSETKGKRKLANSETSQRISGLLTGFKDYLSLKQLCHRKQSTFYDCLQIDCIVQHFVQTSTKKVVKLADYKLY